MLAFSPCSQDPGTASITNGITTVSSYFYFAHFYSRKYSIATTTPMALKDDLSSVTEPESDIKEVQPVPPPPKDDPSSVTEPESDVEEAQPVPPPPKNDPSSIMEPESDIEEPLNKTPMKSATTNPKKKGFFDTPSPPGPDSFYWKYVS
jgi:type IV secretory pathway VirB10-like protein